MPETNRGLFSNLKNPARVNTAYLETPADRMYYLSAQGRDAEALARAVAEKLCALERREFAEIEVPQRIGTATVEIDNPREGLVFVAPGVDLDLGRVERLAAAIGGETLPPAARASRRESVAGYSYRVLDEEDGPVPRARCFRPVSEKEDVGPKWRGAGSERIFTWHVAPLPVSARERTPSEGVRRIWPRFSAQRNRSSYQRERPEAELRDTMQGLWAVYVHPYPHEGEDTGVFSQVVDKNKGSNYWNRPGIAFMPDGRAIELNEKALRGFRLTPELLARRAPLEARRPSEDSMKHTGCFLHAEVYCEYFERTGPPRTFTVPLSGVPANRRPRREVKDDEVELCEGCYYSLPDPPAARRTRYTPGKEPHYGLARLASGAPVFYQKAGPTAQRALAGGGAIFPMVSPGTLAPETLAGATPEEAARLRRRAGEVAALPWAIWSEQLAETPFAEAFPAA